MSWVSMVALACVKQVDIVDLPTAKPDVVLLWVDLWSLRGVHAPAAQFQVVCRYMAWSLRTMPYLRGPVRSASTNLVYRRNEAATGTGIIMRLPYRAICTVHV